MSSRSDSSHGVTIPTPYKLDCRDNTPTPRGAIQYPKAKRVLKGGYTEVAHTKASGEPDVERLERKEAARRQAESVRAAISKPSGAATKQR